MYTLVALIAIVACTLARPPASTDGTASLPDPNERAPLRPSKHFFTDYILPHFLLPNSYAYQDSPRAERQLSENILDKEINLINRMKNVPGPVLRPYDDMPLWMRWLPRPHVPHKMEPNPLLMNPSMNSAEFQDNGPPNSNLTKLTKHVTLSPIKETDQTKRSNNNLNTKEVKHAFALTPFENGYFDREDVDSLPIGKPVIEKEYYRPRITRQNPNLSKAKALVAEDLDRLRIGVSQAYGDGTAKPHHIHVLETKTADNTESIFGIALLAAVGAAFVIAVIGFAIGWYTLSKKAKAAADVDYPAYGVTGPTVDTSGDRKLAQSAHMYHYQHQKQQIIAMERNGIDQRNGSVSDPESEEENEEGDYTVYECPGFATTGDMEVKNPLFQEEATPATPGKPEEAKPQRKE